MALWQWTPIKINNQIECINDILTYTSYQEDAKQKPCINDNKILDDWYKWLKV